MNLQSMRTVYRNRGRLILIVTLLGVSLMFVASMTSLSANAQQELTNVQQQVGTAITITYTANDSQGARSSGSGRSGNTPLPTSAVTTVQHVAARLHSALGNAYNVVSHASDFTTTMDALAAVQNSITLALSVAILTAALIIIFTVLLTIREKNREIGILKALGASHWQVIRQFWAEVLALSAVAALVAVIMLVALGPIISQAFTVSPDASSTSGGVRSGAIFAPLSAANAPLHLSTATLNVETLLIIVGLGMGWRSSRA